MNENLNFPAEIMAIHNEIMKAGVNRSQAEAILAYEGSIFAMQKKSAEKLHKSITRIPGCGGKTANKITNYFKP